MTADAPWLPIGTAFALAALLIAWVVLRAESYPPYWDFRCAGCERKEISDRVFDRRIRVFDRSGGKERPRVLEIENFLSPEECDRIIELGRHHGLAPSTMVFGSEAERARSKADARTSTGVFLDQFSDITLDRIAQRVENLTGIPAVNGEQIQLVHYAPGQHYWSHFDYLPQENVRRQWKSFKAGHTKDNRFATVLFYLNDVEKGGETVFPRFTPHWSAEKYGWDERVCAETFPALRITPRKGNAALFYNMRGWEMDEYSLHGGCDPISGEKYLANVWLHAFPFQ